MLFAGRDEGRPANLPPFCLFTGTEKLLIEEALAEMEETIPAELRDFNVEVLDGRQASATRVVEAARQMPVFASHRLVIVKDAPYFKGTLAAEEEKTLTAYFQNPAPDTVLIFVANEIDRRKALVKLLASRGEVREFKPLTGKELDRWVEKRAERKGFSLTPGALRELILRVGSDLTALEAELEKLSLYVHPRTTADEDDVRAVVSKTLEGRIFDLIDAVAAGKTATALELLRDLLLTGEAPVKIHYMLARQVRILLKAVLLREKGLPESEIISTLNMHPYAARKTVQQSRRFQRRQLLKAMLLLFRTDQAIKLGEGEPAWQLEKAVVRLSQL